MDISLVLSSRNRAGPLRTLLGRLDPEAFRRTGSELVLVDSASDDETPAVMTAFADAADFAVRVVRAHRPGQGHAHNLGVAAARGDVLAFTDDDCEPAPDYFDALRREFDPAFHDYGGGAILPGDPDDDARLATTAWWTFEDRVVLPPRVLQTAGTLQGANMFCRRGALEQVGGFHEDLGPGGRFKGADAELAARFSLSGLTGVLLPQVRVTHHHGRKIGSPEAEATMAGYDRSRGIYYASLAMRAGSAAWDLWSKQLGDKPLSAGALRRLEYELRGAADFLEYTRADPWSRPELAAIPLPAPSIVIEWENAVLSRADRARRMLGEAAAQLAALPRLVRGRPEVLVLCNPGQIDVEELKRLVAEATVAGATAADWSVRETDRPRRYYEQKNYGASLARNDVVVFVDSDVVPEAGWLKALLDPFRSPHVKVVGGASHVDLGSAAGRAFAAFWFFPPRAGDTPLAEAGWFFANNVAFRRETILAEPFPQLDLMRGQCTALAQRLQTRGVAIRHQPRARVSHPAPNGVRHFVARALCDGRDLRDRAGRKRALGTLWAAATEAYGRIGKRREVLKLTAADVAWAWLLCTAYQVLTTAGWTLSVLRPGWIDRRFPI